MAVMNRIECATVDADLFHVKSVFYFALTALHNWATSEC